VNCNSVLHVTIADVWWSKTTFVLTAIYQITSEPGLASSLSILFPGDFVLGGEPAPLPKKWGGAPPPQKKISAHVAEENLMWRGFL